MATCFQAISPTELFTKPFPVLMIVRKRLSEHIVGKGESAGKPTFAPFPQCFLLFLEQVQFLSQINFVICECFHLSLVLNFQNCVKGVPSDFGTKIYENTKKSSLCSQSLFIFIHKTPVVENHPTTREIRDLLQPRLTPTRNTLFLHEHLAHLHSGNT